MPLKNYMLLKGTASDLALDDDQSPHIEIRIEAAGQSYRIAVNARSAIAPHDLLYQRIENFAHPMLPKLVDLGDGATDIRGSDLALDYVRGGFVQRDSMEIAPFQVDGPANDLRDFIEPLVRRGIQDRSVVFYAFGEAWGPESDRPDKYFGFLPGRGIHDIHMNQGSRGRFADTNGPDQDGALLAHIPNENKWIAIFLAFQSQDWNTDADTGYPLESEPPPDQTIDPFTASVSITAALINAPGKEEGGETVTLLNRTDASVDLGGWRIADRVGRSLGLSGRLPAGETLRVTIPERIDAPRLGNRGGEILLLAADGAVSDRVVYTQDEAAREGWTTVF